ncbi:TetR/AcrR family transcriptional regulator [Janibacter hoylei]|uniref:TetR transcriptional regulator n=1 Tax=Janibacter hoylei PVAS-1 TaxID=1210046 RepID=K1ETX2_9MICO|nr:TetR family transcriptional regulator [Janibacter hoylei]EKA62598.1 TetR transcriptional regulator [Janibacter hoylei PVAS-1]RWU83706.1 TetR/AcrR family transcriptional regulator [Janibacter hoylei PVAS-1]
MSTTTDGRSSRWEAHRQERRRTLVESAIRTIRARGASVGMDELAAEAGTSKTVFYRHFSDRHGLYQAVAERVDELILRDIGKVLGENTKRTGLSALDVDPRSVVRAAIDAYLQLVERDPELYRFIVSAPIVVSDRSGNAAEAVATATGKIAGQISDLISAALVDRGNDPAPARLWGHSLVGLVRAGADAWLAGLAGDLTRGELTERLTDLAWSGTKIAWKRPSS